MRWPVALVAATVAYGLVYGLAPDVEPRRIRWITPGAVVGVVLWIVLSLGFAIYVQNFSSYGAAYGAFGAAIVLLLWLYLSANAFLFGAELNAELERAAGDGQASSRSVSSGGWEHRPARPGQVAHSPRCGTAATGNAPAEQRRRASRSSRSSVAASACS